MLKTFAASVATAAAAAVAVLGMSLATAGPASAAPSVGTWRAYGNTNPITSSRSTWACGTTEAVATNVLAQVCAVRSQSGGYVQAAVIVRNNRSGLFGAAAHLEMYDHNTGDQLNEWNCASSGVAAHSWSVCFGETFPWAGLVSASGSVNNYNLYWSPDV